MSFEDIKAEGTRLLNAGDFSGAAAKYAEALAVAPDDVARGALHSNISLAHLKRGALADAERSAATCASLRPEWEKGHFRVGEAAFAARRYEDAVEAYDEALARKPDDPVIAKRLSLAREAISGFYFRQLLPGRDIALRPSNPVDAQIFTAARQMQNFVYLVGDARTRECVVVDACWDVAGILAVASDDKMTVVAAVATHYHFDHVGGVPPPPFDALGIKVPGARECHLANVPVHCHAEDADEISRRCDVPRESVRVAEGASGELLTVGRVRLDFTHTPGHSPGSMVVFVDGNQPGRPGNGAGILVSGDTIFPGSCGRLDLPDADAGRMFDSLARCARVYGDDVVVYPGHNYNGASSTVGKEKTAGLLRPFTKMQWMAMHGR